MMKKLQIFIFVFILALFAEKSFANLTILDDSAHNQILNYLLIDKNDIKLYKNIFRHIDKGEFIEADNLIKELNNHILLGTVLAEKYLHLKYSSSLEELKIWLEKYADYPQAARIYRLAKRKNKGSEEGLKIPDTLGSTFLKERNFDNYTKKYLQKQISLFRRALNSGKTKRARLILEQPKLRKFLPDKNWDDLAAKLAQKYFVDGYDKLAWQWATKAAKRRTSGTASWVAGLAAWRQKQYQNAAIYFSRLAKSKNDDEWLVSAGGYWAYRAYHRLNQSQKAQEMLNISAKYKHTMYGILAAYKLGQTPEYNWNAAAYLNDFSNQEYIYELVSSAYIRRAIILLQSKQPKLAEAELRFGYSDMTTKQQEAVIFIANQYELHSLAIYAGNQCKDILQNRSYDALSYPVPKWWPTYGWNVDKALVLALVRQESAFKVEAESNAGACGLMQLMPRTAYHITKDANLKKDKSRLLKPKYNLDLGQKYINYLSGKTFIDGNLFYLMTAYNAGPGNLLKWQKTIRYNDDALLFIEAIPSAETRIYIERVIANYWIYNMRFSLDNPTLQQVADGQWPFLEK